MERKQTSGVSDVLVHGQDHGLLETRRYVLERSHLRVSITTDFSNAKEMMVSQEPALLILCHSLTADDTRDLLAAARRLRPEMKTLVLTVAHAAEEMSTVHAEFGVFQGPRAFVAKVSQLLGGSESTSF